MRAASFGGCFFFNMNILFQAHDDELCFFQLYHQHQNDLATQMIVFLPRLLDYKFYDERVKTYNKLPKITEIIFSPEIYIPMLAFISLVLTTIFLRKSFYKN